MKFAHSLILMIFFVGCGFLPDIRLNRNVLPSEIVGVWTMTEDSFQDIKTDSDAASLKGTHSDFWIEIREDGTLRYCSLLQMPTRVVDNVGTWKLQPRTDSSKGNELAILLDVNGDYDFVLDFTEDDGKLLLWTYFGDPDSWRLQQYQKTSNKAVVLQTDMIRIFQYGDHVAIAEIIYEP